jgi:hypothetical protein
MTFPENRATLGHRTAQMSLNWIVLGAFVGLTGSLTHEPMAQILSRAIAGMMVMAVPGALLGLLGGDVKGSYAGAAAGFLGCWIAGFSNGASLPPSGVQLVMIFCALLGATCWLYLRFAFWSYRMIALAGWQTINREPAAQHSLFRSHNFRSGHKMRGFLVSSDGRWSFTRTHAGEVTIAQPTPRH